jgi:WXXGXW repeat (2 copies)
MRELTLRSLGASGRILSLAVLIVGATSGLTLGFQQPGGPEVMARGPLHEAFAAPVVFNPTPGVVVPKPPPDPVEEQPPDQKPQGGDVEWIPGYWAWDDERQDYLWISGIWRDIPPGRQWTPGYWSQADGGFRWVSGFWSPVASNGQMSYLPAPPQSLEVGPNTPQPGQDYLWSPGSWTWYESRYVWRPGFWVQAQPEWVWVPPSYVPTPGGYVFIDGYWDHPMERRGVIYAPVVFAPGYLAAPAYVYTPSISLSIGGLTANLFIRPTFGAYYFGDYYGVAAAGPGSGFVAWFSFQQGRHGYDPIFATMAANHWRDPQWAHTIRTEYVYRVEHVEARPAATFAAQRAIIEQRKARGEDIRGMEIAHAANRAELAHNSVRVRPEERARIVERTVAVREASQGRARVEAQARAQAGARPNEHRAQNLAIPHSTIASKVGSEPKTQEHARPAPPAHPEAHAAFRPTLQGQPHQEPLRTAGKPDPRRGVQPGAPHQEPRGGVAKEAHREPKVREPEREKP